MYQFRLGTMHTLISLSAVLVVGVLAWPPSAAALPDCIDYNTSQTEGNCGLGNICQAGGGCVPFDLDVNNLRSDAASLSMHVVSNSKYIHPFPLSSCLGPLTVCQDPTARPSFWSSHGNSGNFSISLSGLRPGRTYTASLYGTFESTVANDTEQATTWPGFPAAPVVSNLQSTAATVAWTTPFPGSTDILYGPLSPSWATEQTIAGPDTFADIAAVSNGQAWAITYNNKLYLRSPAGTWALSSATFASTIYSVDAFDQNTIWIAGNAGGLYRSVDGGASWTQTPAPVGFTNSLAAIVATPGGQAWAAGMDQSILRFDGATWSLQHSGTSGAGLNAITSLEGHVVIAAGADGKVIRTQDEGATWTTQTLPNGSGQNIYALVTIDGTTVWAGGSSGKLWRSQNSGQSWTEISSGTTQTIADLTMLSPTQMIVFTNTSLGRTINATVASPTFTYESQGVIPVFQAATVIHGAEYIGVGGRTIASYDLCHSLCNIKTGPAGTSHTITFTNPDGTGELLANTDYYFAAETFGSGVGYGAFGTFRTLSVDTTPPVIAFTDPNPSPKYTNLTPFPVTGTAQDQDDFGGAGALATITLTNNGNPATVTTNPVLPGPASTNWNAATALTPGMNSLVATARDTSSNQQAANAQLFLDTTLPTLTITMPTNGSTVGTSSITATGTASDNDQVSSMQYQLNGGARQSMSGFTPSAAITWSTSVSGLNLGANTLIVFAKDRAGNERSATVNFTYAEPTFTLNVSPTSQTKNAGDVVTYTVNLAAVNGFDADVSLAITGAPGGSTTSFAPNPVHVNGAVTSTLTINTNPTTTCTCNLTITGTGGSKTVSDTVTLILNPAPDFSLSAIPVSQSITGGQNTSYQIRASSNSTFIGSVAFTLAGTPAGATGAFAPGSVVLGASATQTTTLSITTQPSATAGSHTLTITGTSGSISRTVTVQLNISAPPDFSLALLPASQTVTAGAATSYNGTVTALNGFNQPVLLSATAAPADPGIGMILTPAQFTPVAAGTSFVLNVTTTSGVATGTYTLTITAVSPPPPAAATLTKSATVTLQVNADTTPPIITNIVATPNWDRVRIQWQTNEPADSEIIIYTDAARTSLIGVVSDGIFCTNACHDLVYTPLNPNTTYYFTVTSRDQDTSPPLPTPNSTTATVQADGTTPLQFTTLDEPDSIPPTIRVDQPADGTTVVGNVTIAGEGTDNKKVASIQIVVSAQILTPPYLYDTTISCNTAVCPFSSTWNTTASPNGTYYLSVTAVDAAGNTSPVDSRTIILDNDNTAPRVLTGPNSQVDPIPGKTNCGGGQCYQAVITWTTDDASTSEVDYCAGLTCGYNQQLRYDDADRTNAAPIYTSHQVTLTDLDADQLYHYRITSCNISGLCTH